MKLISRITGGSNYFYFDFREDDILRSFIFDEKNKVVQVSSWSELTAMAWSSTASAQQSKCSVETGEIM